MLNTAAPSYPFEPGADEVISLREAAKKGNVSGSAALAQVT